MLQSFVYSFSNIKSIQLAGLKFSISLEVIERLLLALILPLIILIIGMYSFNTFADSFILLQSTGLSVPITHILIGHILMAFVVEFDSVHTYKILLKRK